jgi:uncharacterized protein (TIGR00725 family)
VKNQTLIGVIGSGSCTDDIKSLAYDVGKGLAEAGYGLICGGMSGVMEGACRGARDGGGLTVGILPGNSPEQSNPYVDVKVVTGMGVARNVIIVHSSRAVIAITGGPGTLSEVAFAIQLGVPVISLKSYTLFPEIIQVDTPEAALAGLKKLVPLQK